MKKNNKIKYIQFPLRKKVCCVLVATVMFATSMPNMLYEELSSISITAYAKNEDNLTDERKPATDKSFDGTTIASPADLEEYSLYYYYYPNEHHDDNIIIQYAEDETNNTSKDFIAIGTAEHPFDGAITIIATTGDSDIKIPESFFNYVSDKATITGTLILQRSTKDSSEPVFARYITHDSTTQTPNSWNVKIDNYVNDYGTTVSDNYFSGFIGEMQKGAMASINIEDNTEANIVGTDDLGYVCGKMGRNTRLTATITGSHSGYSVTTSSGNVGGIVGSMDDSSVLTLKSAPLYTSASITTNDTTSGYAGGIVGYNDGGIVKLDSNLASYTIGGTITGKTAAGGMFGYYRPLFDDPTTNDTTETNAGDIDLSKYSVDATISSSGNVGGLFGTLYNKTVSILETTENNTITETRTDAAGGTITISGGSVTCTLNGSTDIGGIAGEYQPYSLADTLEISSVTTNITNNGLYNNYGGAIGLISTITHNDVTEAAYVKFTSFTLSGASSCDTSDKYFGGLIGKGDKTFVDASGIDITATNFRGGGAVGSLENGVLKLSGTVDLSDAKPSETGLKATKEGQVVGYRNDALIYSDCADLSISDRKVDNVGSWGDILVIDGTKLTKQTEDTPSNTDVLKEDGHTITMVASSSVLNNAADFARLSLAMQIEYSNNNIITGTSANPTTVTIGTAATDETAASNAVIDLTGTGLKGLTRDNAVGTDTKYKSPITTIEGTKDSSENRSGIKLDIENVGGNPIYRHAYNGLIGEATAAMTITNVDFDGTVRLEPCVEMYAGLAAAKSVTITANTCNVLNTADFSDYYHVTGSGNDKKEWGSSDLYLGRLVGNANGAVTIDGGAYSGKIGDPTTPTNAWASSANNCYGGIIGQITSGASSFTDVTVSGTIKNNRSKTTQKLGGLAAVITRDAGAITLSNVTTNGLTVYGNATDSCGGLLGYGWYNSDVTVGDSNTVGVNVGTSTTEGEVTTVTGSSTVTATAGGTAGLVYCATGKWTVNKLAINGLTVTSGPSSYGMIVNKGWDKGSDGKATKQAIYMLLPNGYSYVINNDSVTTGSPAVFDELVAYSAEGGNVTENGQGIVSIHTSGDALIMNGNAANTYTAQTTYGKSHSNSNTRYYYNLDIIAKSSANSITGDNAAQKKLMNWGLYQYACSNIRGNFCDPFGTEITTDTYNMVGYSWYPVDVDSNIEVNGIFKFYNHEIETGIGAKTDTKYKTLETTQHYLMQNALFHNVNKKLTVGSVTLRGNVGFTGDGSGALVCGIVKGSSSSDNDTAEVKVDTGITLDGIHVHNLDADSDYAPLLINKTGNYSTLTIKGVKVSGTGEGDYNNSSDTSLFKDDTYSMPKIATSLIGDAGESASSLNISVSFSDIQLDGRMHGTLSGDTALNGKYHTDESLFTKATLLNRLIYSTGGGTYDFNSTEDWTGATHAPITVTYGSEISDSTERKEFFGQEFWYKDGQGTDADNYTIGTYVHPVALGETGWIASSLTGNAYATTTAGVTRWTAPYDFSGFLPYVYTKYSGAATEGVTGAHQLKVNHVSAAFSGCGTYNDPYIIVSGDDFKKIESIINGDYSDISLASITLPTKTESGSTTFDSTATWCSQHASYSIKATTSTTVSCTHDSDTVNEEALRTYLAGAYYKINEGSTITITDDDTHSFTGFGNISNADHTYAVFRGVIVGTGTETIINQTEYPLIASSYGSVVRGVTIEVDAAITKSNDTATNPFTPNTSDSSCSYYGAVIGQIFGGDNIIDNVYVDYSDATVTISGTNPQVIPVGGYVGVLLNGGLYFRNMDRTNSLVGGLPNEKTHYSSTSGENLITKTTTVSGVTKNEPNMKYLYVNPIIGRVMNGFAITETTVFRPFEDGTRTYPDGSHVYFDGTNYVEKAADETFSGTPVGVTMRNGTKNYSIADINKNDSLNIFTVTAPSGNNKHPGEKDSTVTVNNAQSLFIISLIVDSGLATSSNGKYDDTNNLLKPYTTNTSTRMADYSYVGSSALPTAVPNSFITNPTTDAQKASNDYYNSKSDILNSGTNSDNMLPHIIKTYSPDGDSSYPYPAFDLSAFTSTAKNNELYLNMTFSDSGDSTYYMPDGFKGLGSILLGPEKVNNAYRAWNDSYRLYNTMFLYSLNGSNRKVSINMQLLLYQDDNYTTPTYNQAYLKTGFGFFNALRSDYSTTYDNRRLKNLTITGSVKYDLIDKSTGSSIEYNAKTISKETDPSKGAQNRPAVGGFIGAPGVDTQVSGSSDGGGGSMYFENIRIENISVYGVKYAGGIVGCSNAGDNKGSIKYIFRGCSADNIRVQAGLCAGGMIGYVRNQYSVLDADFEGKEYGIIEVQSMHKEGQNENAHGFVSAGGLIGDFGANKSNVGKVTIKNVTIKNASSFDTGSIDFDTYDNTYWNNNSPCVGGVLGAADRNGTIEFDNVTVKNLDIKGNRSGGMIGFCQGDGYPVTISNSAVVTDQNCRIYNYHNDNNCASGGIIGYTTKNSNVTIQNSYVKGYSIISEYNAGGLVGRKGGTGTLYLKNDYAESVDIYNNNNGGGLVGQIDGGEISGYNVLLNDTTLQKQTTIKKNSVKTTVMNGKTKVSEITVNYYGEFDLDVGKTTTSSTDDNTGYTTTVISEVTLVSTNYNNEGAIIGYNNNPKIIKLVGFSRQGGDLPERTVGNFAPTAKNQYGGTVASPTGYVVFADYKGTALTSGKNEEFSTVIKSGTINVEAADPFVTVNTKRVIDADSTPKFLTGDGIYNSSSTPNYAGSMIKNIITDAQGSNANRYQSTGLTVSGDSNDLDALKTNLNTNKKYTTYVTARGSSTLTNEALRNMPVLILDDSNPANTTTTVNNYLRLLTNTNFDFATRDDAFTVNIAKCTYNDSGVLNIEYSGANLEIDSTNSQFKLSGSEYDNSYISSDSSKNIEQFTLIDVAFKNPATTSIAYHLYVPVFVKKMLYFDFYAGSVSGTTYRIAPYEAVYGNSIVENTGNPITVQFRWIYKRELDDWVKYIDSGESLLWNYEKILDVTDRTRISLPSDTKMVLVDANDNNHAYYGTASTTDLFTITDNKLTAINLNKFESSDSTTEIPDRFTPINFNDFFDITTTIPTGWEKDGDSGYYKTSNTFVVDNNNGTVKIGTSKYKVGTGDGAVNLYVKFKDGMTFTTSDSTPITYLKEEYYITFFTPAAKDDPIRHLEFGTAKTFPDDAANPTNRSVQKPTHFYIGDIFDNGFKIQATTDNPVMNENNSTLNATMTVDIGVKPTAGANLGTVLNLSTVHIYQSFLMSLKKTYFDENDSKQTELGFSEGSNPLVTVTEFKIAGESVDDLHESNNEIKTLNQMSGNYAIIDANYLELRSCADISKKLYTQYNAYATAINDNPDQTTVKNTITIQAKVELEYATVEQIEAQFPENIAPTSTQGQQTGTSIEGYSRISTQPDSAKYSNTSKHDEDGDNSVSPSEPVHLYYREAFKKASLNYYSADTKTVVITPAQGETPAVTEEQLLTKNKYGQLGINPLESEELIEFALKTRADYSINKLTTETKASISSIRVTVKMFTKADSYDPDNPLTIEDYIDVSTLTFPNTYSKDTSNSSGEAYVYTAPITYSDFTNDVLHIPINYSVYSGKNNQFEAASPGKQYSNYMVHLDVELYDSSGKLITGSDVDSHLIYTNAKVCYDIVTPPSGS